jgi:hypothetical protein
MINRNEKERKLSFDMKRCYFIIRLRKPVKMASHNLLVNFNHISLFHDAFSDSQVM